jgi:hypothetical protein
MPLTFRRPISANQKKFGTFRLLLQTQRVEMAAARLGGRSKIVTTVRPN